jgi:hypothetical protein
VTALTPLDEQAAVDETVQVLGRGGARDSGLGRQLARSPRATVEECKAHGRARLVCQKSRERRQVRR